ncbi:MAG: hypothetical protein JRI23_02115 [Deltaproteobacteria bacterium]|nr:hypothetical protein [Deltaproteobacteria bacterium]MBW2530274.1 hypothetical protein [Deltaproteobacteria bacterium]
MVRQDVRWAARVWLALALLVPIGLAGGDANGQVSREDSAAAQVLFDDGVKLRKEEAYEQACPKFAESHRLDPQLGTLMNLADCYEKWGKTASAWISFVEAEGIARKKKDRRARIARKRAEGLEGRLQKMQLEVAERPEGLKITRNGAEVRPPMWGSELPVDPGEHVIEATAPGYETWSTTVTVSEGDELAVVEVPVLEESSNDDPSEGAGEGTGATDGPDEAAGEGPHMPLLVSGIAAGVVGLGGIGAGVGLGLMSTAKNDESLEHCRPEDPNLCDPEGVELRDEARSLETGTIVAYVAGGAVLATGVVLVALAFVMGDGDEEAETAGADGARRRAAASGPGLELLPSAGPEGAGVLLRGRF